MARLLDAGECEAVLWPHKSALILAVRGSDSTIDWVRNLDATLEMDALHKLGLVHQGFDRAALEMWRFRPFLEGIDTAPSACYLAGHSQGGAVATLLAHWLAVLFEPSRIPVYLATFGSPRVLSKAAVKGYDLLAGHVRVVHGHDIVPTVPSLGYEHVGDPMLIGNDALARLCWSIGSLLKPAQRWKQGWEDHHISHYVAETPDEAPWPTLLNYEDLPDA